MSFNFEKTSDDSIIKVSVRLRSDIDYRNRVEFLNILDYRFWPSTNEMQMNRK